MLVRLGVLVLDLLGDAVEPVLLAADDRVAYRCTLFWLGPLDAGDLVPAERLGIVERHAVLPGHLAVLGAEFAAEPVAVEHRVGGDLAGAFRRWSGIAAVAALAVGGRQVLGPRADRTVHHVERLGEDAVGQVRRPHRIDRDRGDYQHHEHRPAGGGHRVAHVGLPGSPHQVDADHGQRDRAERGEHLLVDGLGGAGDQAVRPAPQRARVPGLFPYGVRRSDHAAGQLELPVGDHVLGGDPGIGARRPAAQAVGVEVVAGVPVVDVDAGIVSVLRGLRARGEPSRESGVRSARYGSVQARVRRLGKLFGAALPVLLPLARVAFLGRVGRAREEQAAEAHHRDGEQQRHPSLAWRCRCVRRLAPGQSYEHQASPVSSLGGPDGGPEAGAAETGTPDTGIPDTGTPDTGTPDTGTPDTGTPDTGAMCPGLPAWLPPGVVSR